MADDSSPVDQDEIERLLQQGSKGNTSSKTDSIGSGTTSSRTALEQNEIESLMKGAVPKESSSTSIPNKESTPYTSALRDALRTDGASIPSSNPAYTPGTSVGESQLARGDVELLLNQAEEALASIDTPTTSGAIQGTTSFQLHEFIGASPSADRATFDLLRDVDLNLKIELGRTHMHLEDVLKLRKGSVVSLDKLAGDPVDVYVNGRLIARGEVLVLNDNFCVRVAELIAGEPVKSN